MGLKWTMLRKKSAGEIEQCRDNKSKAECVRYERFCRFLIYSAVEILWFSQFLQLSYDNENFKKRCFLFISFIVGEKSYFEKFSKKNTAIWWFDFSLRRNFMISWCFQCIFVNCWDSVVLIVLFIDNRIE